MILTSKKQYFSKLVFSVSEDFNLQSICGKLLTIYFIPNLLHHYLPCSSLADSFANFLKDKISKLHISLTLNTSLQLKLPVFSTRQHICLARYMLSPVRPSVCRVYHRKTVEVRVIKLLRGKFHPETLRGSPEPSRQTREGR